MDTSTTVVQPLAVREDKQPTGAPATVAQNAVPFWKVLMLGICAMAVGPNLALSAGYQLHYSGLRSWLALTGAALISMVVAVSISRFARRYAVTASILSYAQETMPRWAVSVTAASLLFGYVIGPAVGVLSATIYLSSLLSSLGIYGADSVISQCVITIIASVFIGACAYRGVAVSAKVAISLGLACVPVAIWITLVAAPSAGPQFLKELNLHDETSISLSRGVFVAMAFFVGFDGVGALASQTADPRVSVPRILQWSIVISGLTLALGAFLQAPVLLMHVAALESGESPTKILANAAGLARFAIMADVVLALASIAGLIAWLNCAAAIVAAAASDGFLPRALGRTHNRFNSPHRAVVFLSVVSIVLPVVLITWTGAAPILSTLYLTNIDVLLWLMPYAIICLGALKLRDPDKKDGATRTMSAIGLIAILAIIAAQVMFPIDHIAELVNAVGAAIIVAGTVIFFIIRPTPLSMSAQA